MITKAFTTTMIGWYTNDGEGLVTSLICPNCAITWGRTDINEDDYATYDGYPDGYTCAECGFVVPCHPVDCTCKTETNYYTVTATGTYFVSAKDRSEAETLVYEAMLGNDPKNLLDIGEVHLGTMVVQEGTHYTISHTEYEPF